MRRATLFSSLCLAVICLASAEPQKPLNPRWPLGGVGLHEELREAARKEGIEVRQGSLVLAEQARPGDRVLTLIGACDGHSTSQWLLELSRGNLKSGEDREHQVTLHSSWGPVSHFKSQMEAIELVLVGPVQTSVEAGPVKAPKLEVKRARVLVPGDFLRLGLDGSARSCFKLRQGVLEIMKQEPKFQLSFYSTPTKVSNEVIQANRPVARRMGRTEEDERLFAGAMLALSNFYTLANAEASLRDIVRIAVDQPSVWKMAKVAMGVSVNTNFTLDDNLRQATEGEIGILPVHRETWIMPFNLSFDNSPLVLCVMMVTQPAPPLDVSAGILHLLAVHPKDEKRVVEIKVL